MTTRTEIEDDESQVAASGDDAGKALERDIAAGPTRRRRHSWKHLLAYGVLPALAMALAICAGFLKWQADSPRASQMASAESIRAATDSTIALLSYQPETVDEQLTAARDRVAGTFRDDYTKLTTEVVIPGAKQQHISAAASVSAAAPVSATDHRAVVLLFINQTVTIGKDAPTNTASSVLVTLDKIDDRWLISQFEPV